MGTHKNLLSVENLKENLVSGNSKSFFPNYLHAIPIYKRASGTFFSFFLLLKTIFIEVLLCIYSTYTMHYLNIGMCFNHHVDSAIVGQ